ncbi:AMP-binding protein [Comamonas endophytica]|uniref:AMP-binding protein n=1 Tax=Comamonas endophytica TaxID=2949090 RepID=UPI00361E2D31
MQLTLGDTLSWPARYLPRKEALVAWEGGRRRAWTYGQLDAEVNRHAHGLQALGIARGDVVAAFLYNTPAFVFTLLAAARIGAVFNPVNYRLAPQELAFILQDGQARALVFEREVADVVALTQALLAGESVRPEHWIYAGEGEADATPQGASARLGRWPRTARARRPRSLSMKWTLAS